MRVLYCSSLNQFTIGIPNIHITKVFQVPQVLIIKYLINLLKRLTFMNAHIINMLLLPTVIQ